MSTTIDHTVNIKNDLSSDLSKMLNRFLDRYNYEGNEGNMYVGRVVDNMDPEKIGRCKIMVYSVFDDTIPVSDLPWAVPEFGFVGSLKGSFIVPRVGTFVTVRFDSGEINLPIYSTKVLNLSQLPTNKDDDYPNNLIFFETDNGDKAEINLVNRSAVFEHASGAKIYFDDGSINLEQPNGNTINMQDDAIVIKHSSGNTITVDSTGIEIDAVVGDVKTRHTGFLDDNGSAVIPSPAPALGPFIAAPGGVCPISGMILSGQKCAPPTQ